MLKRHKQLTESMLDLKLYQWFSETTTKQIADKLRTRLDAKLWSKVGDLQIPVSAALEGGYD